MRRYQDPPSHSRILIGLDETQLEKDTSSLAKDEEISRLFKDKFDRSIDSVSRFSRRDEGKSALIDRKNLLDESSVEITRMDVSAIQNQQKPKDVSQINTPFSE